MNTSYLQVIQPALVFSYLNNDTEKSEGYIDHILDKFLVIKLYRDRKPSGLQKYLCEGV